MRVGVLELALGEKRPCPMQHLDVADIRRFEAEFIDFVARERKQILDVIAETKDLSDDTVAAMEKAVADFKQQFRTSDGNMLINEAPAEALDAAAVGQEQVTRYVPKKA